MKKTMIAKSNVKVAAVNTKDGKFIYVARFDAQDAVTGKMSHCSVWGNTPAKEKALRAQAQYLTPGRIFSWEESKADEQFHSSNGFIADLGNMRIK